MKRRPTAYELMKRLRGAPVRPKQTHKDHKKDGRRKACRGKPKETE